jgi:hypothetical protein
MKTCRPHHQCLAVVVLVSCLASIGCAPARFENEFVSPNVLPASPAAIPRGFRRTKHGWEDASLWGLPGEVQRRSLESWVDRQRQREPGWVRRGIDEIRETPPWMVAVLEISAIAAIVRLTRRQPREPDA